MLILLCAAAFAWWAIEQVRGARWRRMQSRERIAAQRERISLAAWERAENDEAARR